jgi:small subunit ribosomal protein S6
MRRYETMIVVPPNVSESDLDNLIKGYEDELKSRHGASEAVVQKWGKRNLSYPIQKFTEGYYVLCDYQSEKEDIIQSFEGRLRVSETILRFLTIRRDEEMKSEARMKEKLLKRGKSGAKEDSNDFDGFADEDGDMD